MKKNNIFLISLLLMGFVLILTRSCTKDDNKDQTIDATVKDIDGNVYKTVTLDKQVWMVDNLKVTKYNDNSNIPTANFGWYNNDMTANKNIYGALYDWTAVNTGKLAPSGWHVPSDTEWQTLSIYLKSSGKSFTPTLGGAKFSSGFFAGKDQTGYWWSSTIISTFGNTNSCSRRLDGLIGTYDYDESPRNEWLSLRCLKN